MRMRTMQKTSLVSEEIYHQDFNATKDGDQTFLPIGLSTFASIGRLLAVVQYHSRYDELKTTT